jgi:hypothetical protein
VLSGATSVATSNPGSAQINKLTYCSSFLYAVGYYTTVPTVNGVSPQDFGGTRRNSFLLSVNPTPADPTLQYKATTYLVGWNDNTLDTTARFVGCATIAQQIVVVGDYGTNTDMFLASFDDNIGTLSQIKRYKDANSVGMTVSSDNIFLLGTYRSRLWNLTATTSNSNFVAKFSTATLPAIP